MTKPLWQRHKMSRTKTCNRDKASIYTQVKMTTYTRWEVVVPCSSLPSHALQYATAMQGVTLVTSERDGTSSKVTLVTDFEAKLWHTWIITVGQLKTWTRKIHRQTEKGEKNREEHELKNDIMWRPWTHTNTELPSPQKSSHSVSQHHIFIHLYCKKVLIELWELIYRWAQMRAGLTVPLYYLAVNDSFLDREHN